MYRFIVGLVFILSVGFAASGRAQSCTTCHGSDIEPAPPLDTSGNSDTVATGVGAHRSHLGVSTWHAEMTCTECHVVPQKINDAGHYDTSLPAELVWGPLADADGAVSAWNGTTCTTYCHGSTLSEGGFAPQWTRVDGSQATCGTCHGAPPALPHSQLSDCSRCHPGVDALMTITDPAQHIDGAVQTLAFTCVSCHGSGSESAPPVDTSGSSDTADVGVGAHRNHLGASTWHVEMTCAECHLVPMATDDPGHVDTSLPAELVWGPLADADGAVSAWNGTTCTTYCHGSTLSEGGFAPRWTLVDGSQATCGTCHGTPPALPHSQQSDCSQCHPGVDALMTITDPAQHVDGTVQAVDPVPVIVSIADEPEDQGGQVRLSWLRSSFDDAGSGIPITDYAVWRQISSGAREAEDSKSLAERATSLPGDWDQVATVAALAEAQYNVLAPTLCDSTADGLCLSTFFVSALTADPLVYFDSASASGYSVDNLAPAAPGNLLLAGTLLSWDEMAEVDFDYFTIYGSASATLDGTAVVMDTTVGISFDVTAHPYVYYHVTATDLAGNEGPAATTSSVSGASGDLPPQYALHGNVPNPFNPRTTIRFELANSERVTLAVYDLSGRLVRTLVAREYLVKGSHSQVWDGTNAANHTVSAGVYLYRIETPGYSKTRRMLLVK